MLIRFSTVNDIVQLSPNDETKYEGTETNTAGSMLVLQPVLYIYDELSLVMVSLTNKVNHRDKLYAQQNSFIKALMF